MAALGGGCVEFGNERQQNAQHEIVITAASLPVGDMSVMACFEDAAPKMVGFDR